MPYSPCSYSYLHCCQSVLVILILCWFCSACFLCAYMFVTCQLKIYLSMYGVKKHVVYVCRSESWEICQMVARHHAHLVLRVTSWPRMASLRVHWAIFVVCRRHHDVCRISQRRCSWIRRTRPTCVRCVIKWCAIRWNLETAVIAAVPAASSNLSGQLRLCLKPCPHWRLAKIGSATVVAIVDSSATIVAVFGASRRFWRLWSPETATITYLLV